LAFLSSLSIISFALAEILWLIIYIVAIDVPNLQLNGFEVLTSYLTKINGLKAAKLSLC
jgi:hypothetical protein